MYNGHGDVAQLTDSSGNAIKNYDYDAWGVEKDLDPNDINPFRYAAEYFDANSGLYYLRARSYNPSIGRFLTEDTHWNPYNSIYGDNPLKINERQDPNGLNLYTYIPDINAIRQSSNLYVYCGNNPILYVDSNGEIFMLVTGAIGAVAGGIGGAVYSQVKYGEVRWQNVTAGAAIGGAIGLTGGAAAGVFLAGSATASTGAVLTGAGIIGAGSGTVVIGETMRRVTDYASRIDAKTYSGLVSYSDLASKYGTKVANFLGKADNAKWLLSEMLNNSKIVDIGIDLDRASRSSSYLMERILSFFYSNKEIVIQIIEKSGK